MDSAVLTLQWPENFDPSDVKRFETEARTLRYQALGRACRARKITNLMVAHHADDQAETVFMRLANNRLRSGLQGMQSVEWIPECEGIYGVHHSGGFQAPDPSLTIPFAVERGGIRILRPLLAFEKSRLIATCKNSGVKWVEDKTNLIPTLTSRNAIRHIYKHHQLPEALSIKSLVDVSLAMQKRIQTHKNFAAKLFDQCLIKLDIQTGSVLVRFPPFPSLLDHPIDSDSRFKEARNNAYCLIERVAALVSPRSKAQLGSLAATIGRIYPELDDAAEEDEIGTPTCMRTRPQHSKVQNWANTLTKNYSVFSVWWRRWDKATPFPDVPEADCDSVQPHPREWLLSRQPVEAKKKGDSSMQITYPPSSMANSGQPLFGPREPYQLFDGRFWIRLHNHTPDPMILRLFDRSDHHHFPTSREEGKNPWRSDHLRPHRYLSAAFDLLEPSDLCYTLPALFRVDHETGKETLIGFPTLNVRMNGFGPPHGCEWSVRYKKVDLGNHSVGSTIVPGLSRKMIEAEEKRQRIKSQGILRLQQKKGQIVGPAGEPDMFTGFKRGMHATRASEKEVVNKMNASEQTVEVEEAEQLGFLKSNGNDEPNHDKSK